MGREAGFIRRAVQGARKAKADDIGQQYSTGMAQKVAGFEMDELSQMTGVLPIKVKIPEQGRLFKFSKLLVTEKESSWLALNYTGLWIKLRGLIRLFVLLVIVIFIWRIIQRSSRKRQTINSGAV